MKKRTIIGLVLLVGFASVLFLNFGSQVGGYMPFTEAQASGSSAHVIGTWVEGAGQAYDPASNVFSFTMRDEVGTEQRVVYRNPKPANFEDADKLVVEGHFEGGQFVADHILVKCPSKYNEQRAAEKLGVTS